MKITSVIVTYNRKDLLYKSLQSILEQTKEVNKILVINNCSTDGTIEMLQKEFVQHSKIEIITLDKNIGGAGGFKYGINLAMKDTSDWISISDDDAILSKDFFEKMEQYQKRNQDIKCFSGTVFENGKINTAHRGKLTSDELSLFSDIQEENYTQNFDLDIASFVGLLVHKEVVHSVGLPREDYFIWYDDVDYSLKIRKKYRIINISDAIIYHEVAKEMIRYSGRNRKIIWKDYYGYRNRWHTLKTHSLNQLQAKKRIRYEYYKALFGSLIKKRGDRGKLASMKLVYDAHQAFSKETMGINAKYLP